MTDQPEVGGTAIETRDDGKRSVLTDVKGLNNFRADLMRFHGQFVALLGSEMEANVFIETVTTAFITTPKLAQCEPVSMMLAVRRSAQLKLRPDGVEGAFIPRGKEATFMPMFQGIVRKMLRAGTVKKVEARVVKTGDSFEYEFGLAPKLIHRAGPSQDRAGTTHVYAIVWLTNGETQFEVMDFEETESIRRISKSNNKGAEGPAWRNYPDEMRRKIVLKRLSKYVEQDAEMSAVIAYDHALDEGRDIDPADMLPQIEDRSIQQRVTDHADRQTSDLRAAMDKATLTAEPGDEDPLLKEAYDKARSRAEADGNTYDLTQVEAAYEAQNTDWLMNIHEELGQRGKDS